MADNLYNPDVLSCLANLSNDEVFTPPSVVNQMLDMLPQELFRSGKTTFLDIGCKSGVFLREITKRLIAGLADEMPDLQTRVDHILHKQVFGIATTELTSLVSRRTLYCSKYPNCRYSTSPFKTVEGNIRFRNIAHTFVNGRCKWCGASEDQFGPKVRKGLETHAYEFIHTDHPEEIFKMKFDVIVGNPPYQLNDGGGEGSSAAPLYQLFIENSLKLNPRYLTMIVPARWYSGGKGLDSFRDQMLHDQRICRIEDFPETQDCFPGVNIRGGVCYFLWSRDHRGDCCVVNHQKGKSTAQTRPLLEKSATTFIRYNAAIDILRKVMALNEDVMSNRVQSRLPFGIPSNFSDYSLSQTKAKCVRLYRSERSATAAKQVYVGAVDILKNIEWKDRMKVLVSKASPGGDDYPHAIISEPIFAGRNSVCTETYLIVDFVDDREKGENLISYMRTRFFRFMMALIKNTQNISRGVFAFVPIQDFSKPWTDAELYAKYKLTKDEIAFIESMIKPME